ncbi:MAG TPA: D-alanyl-D-alanine carboxypeptidase [Thermoanaerobacterales bacterium]|nr:D-alanyl-D-alanine carboxypeptidase [Thermoanaerobacterales bacterium]
MLRKTLILLFIFIIACSSSVKADTLYVNARAYILMEPITCRILIEKNSEVKMPMASTTKIMTAIIALEKGNLESKVKVSAKAASIGGSSFYLKAGETMSLENMLYGLLLPSGNDAAVAIAEHISGNEKNFVDLMNLKALEIGALNTHFMNPHGLDEPGHYTTARDLAMIARYAWSIPKFREIVQTREKVINDGIHERHIYNTNRLLGSKIGVNGIKTGYTGGAGKCLVASAAMNRFQLISVVLGSGDHFGNSYNLLDYGFSHYKYKQVVVKDRPYTNVLVENGILDRALLVAGGDIFLPVGENETVDLKMIVPDSIKAPVMKNQPIGEILVFINGKQVCKTILVSTQDIREKTYFDMLYRILREWLNLNIDTGYLKNGI